MNEYTFLFNLRQYNQTHEEKYLKSAYGDVEFDPMKENVFYNIMIEVNKIQYKYKFGQRFKLKNDNNIYQVYHMCNHRQYNNTFIFFENTYFTWLTTPMNCNMLVLESDMIVDYVM